VSGPSSPLSGLLSVGKEEKVRDFVRGTKFRFLLSGLVASNRAFVLATMEVLGMWGKLRTF